MYRVGSKNSFVCAFCLLVDGRETYIAYYIQGNRNGFRKVQILVFFSTKTLNVN